MKIWKPVKYLPVLILLMSLIVLIMIRTVSCEAADVEVETWDELTNAVNGIFPEEETEDEEEEGSEEQQDDSEDDEEDLSKIEIVLVADIKAEGVISPIIIRKDKTITLDLAGHTLDRGLADKDKEADGYVIKVEGEGTLILTDSTKNPGLITGGANISDGGGILCEDGAVLTVEKGVTIQYNRAKNGGGICLGKGSELYLADCSITENDAIGNGGGIYGGESVLTFLGGLTRIKNNTKNDDTDNDLYIPSNMERLRFWSWSGTDERRRKAVYSEEFLKPSRIGILLQVMQKEISDGYGQCNSAEASVYFFYNGSNYVVSDNRKKSEITIEKDPDIVQTVKTVLSIYKNGKLKSEKEYDSFAAAYEAGTDSSDEAVVTLGSDVTTTSEIVLAAKESVTIDLNGHYIKRQMKEDYKTEKNGSVFHVKKGATLTISDSHPKAKGYDGVKGGVIAGGASSNGGGGITVDKGGHLVMTGGTIYDCVSDYNGGGVFIDTGSSDTSFTMTGGRIYHCRAVDSIDKVHGGGVFFGDGKLNIKDATIDNCYAENNGGGIYCRRGEMKLDNVLFSGDKAWDRGGGIYIDLDIAKYKGTLIYAGNCTFINNEAEEDGGAFCMRDNPENKGAVILDRCAFRDNTAREDGGAIEALDDGLVLSNVEIIRNKAGGYGGGVYVDPRYDINVKGLVVIKDNTSDKTSRCNDLALGSSTLGTAYVYSGGLLKGSWIGIGSESGKSKCLAKNISVYEMEYFHLKQGKLGTKKTKKIKVDMVVTASIFSRGWKAMAIIGSIGILSAAGLVIYKRRKGFRSGVEGRL